METGSIKEYDCDGTNGDTLNIAIASYQNVVSNGDSEYTLLSLQHLQTYQKSVGRLAERLYNYLRIVCWEKLHHDDSM